MQRYSNYGPAYGAESSTDPYVTATFSVPTLGHFSTSSGDYSQFGYTTVVRNSSPNPGYNYFDLAADGQSSSGEIVDLQLSTFDNLGAASGIFKDPLGGLSDTQPIDWFAAGSATNPISGFPGTYGSFQHSGYDASGAWFSTVGYFLLDSAHVTPVPEPDTTALLLAGIGLVGFIAATRRGRKSPSCAS